eukprot:1428966-Pleurochrysis_carterae.AAC.3
MSTVGGVFENVLAAGVTSCSQVVDSASHQLVGLVQLTSVVWRDIGRRPAVRGSGGRGESRWYTAATPRLQHMPRKNIWQAAADRPSQRGGCELSPPGTRVVVDAVHLVARLR